MREADPALPELPRAPGLPTGAAPWIGRGVVRHARWRPVRHAFAYPTWFVLLPMRPAPDSAAAAPWPLARNRPGLASFWDRDHGDGQDDALAWLDGVLRQAGVGDAQGAVWLHTLPRVLGVVFKPVSFWYAHRPDGALAAIVAEVNNTFGERHVYVLPSPGWGRDQIACKALHVSPFNRVEGRYRFRFYTGETATGWRTLAAVDLDDDAGRLLGTSVGGHLEPLTRAGLRRAMVAVPWLSLGVLLRIHWQALQLWRKRLPFFRKPAPPSQAVSLGGPAGEHGAPPFLPRVTDAPPARPLAP